MYDEKISPPPAFVRQCRCKLTGEVFHLPVAAFAGGARAWVTEIGEPFNWHERPETAMKTGGQRNAMREKATARG